jgi:hypothetical protein
MAQMVALAAAALPTQRLEVLELRVRASLALTVVQIKAAVAVAQQPQVLLKMEATVFHLLSLAPR